MIHEQLLLDNICNICLRSSWLHILTDQFWSLFIYKISYIGNSENSLSVILEFWYELKFHLTLKIWYESSLFFITKNEVSFEFFLWIELDAHVDGFHISVFWTSRFQRFHTFRIKNSHFFVGLVVQNVLRFLYELQDLRRAYHMQHDNRSRRQVRYSLEANGIEDTFTWKEYEESIMASSIHLLQMLRTQSFSRTCTFDLSSSNAHGTHLLQCLLPWVAFVSSVRSSW